MVVKNHNSRRFNANEDDNIWIAVTNDKYLVPYLRSSPMGKYALLRQNIERRVKISDQEWEALKSILVEKHVAKKEFLLRAGDICEFNHYILKGCTRTFYTDDNMHEHIFQIGFEDWWAGDMMSYLTGEPAHYSIQALEDTDVVMMRMNEFDEVLATYPKLERFFRILLQNAYIAGQKRTIDTMSKSAEVRYLELVKKYPQMEMRVAQQHIASYLGITPEALSRIKRGIIEKSRSH
jgi:CRP-like cAMP-binding protein